MKIGRAKALWKVPELWKNQKGVFPQLLGPSVHTSHNAGCYWTFLKHNFPSTPSGRSGGGQGLSQQRYAGGAEGSGSTGVYLGTGSRTAAMERQAGSTGGSVLESAADSGRARETFVAAARRVAGTQLRPRLRDGRDAARVLARTKQCSQASADSRGSAQPVAGDAETGG